MKPRFSHDDAQVDGVMDSIMSTAAARVMELWDAGWGQSAIASKLGLRLATVQRYVNTYDVGLSQDLAYARRVRVSDISYQAALAASGGMYR